jgi:hypothetical protein
MANAVLDPAPSRDDLRASSWGRWFNQLYAVVQNIFSGATFTNPTLTGTVTASGGSVYLPSVNIAVGNNWGDAWTPAFTGGGSMTVALANRFETVSYRMGALTFVKVYAQLTLGGTASNLITLPLPSTNFGNNSLLNAWISPANSSSWVPAFCYANAGSTTLAILPQQYVNYALGTLYVVVSGFYQS